MSDDSASATLPRNAAPSTSGGTEPIRVCLLGSEGAGKTCFLAGLAILAEPNRATSITVSPTDTVTSEYLDELSGTLRRQQWPPPTSMTSVLTLRIGLRGRAIEILIVDYPGEDFRRALRQLKHDEIETLYRHFSQAEATLLLFDPERDIRVCDDPQQTEDQIERQLAHLQAISEAWAKRSGVATSRQKPTIDVGVIVTKSDSEPDLLSLGGTRRFFQQHAKALDDKLRRLADVVEYFACSAIGEAEIVERGEDTLTLPAALLKPTGYESIFHWIVERHQWRKNRVRRRVFTTLFVFVLLGIAGAFAWREYDQQRNLQIVRDAGRSPSERLEDTATSQNEMVRQERSRLVQAEIDKLAKQLSAVTREAEVDEVLAGVDRLVASHPGALASRVEGLRADARKSRETLVFQQVQDTFTASSGQFAETAERFLSQYPASELASQVRDFRDQARVRERELDRQRIQRLKVFDAKTLKSKSEAIFDFVAAHESDLTADEVRRMRRAAELARRFTESNTYSVELKRSGGFLTARDQGVRLYLGKELTREYNSPGESRTVTWEVAPLKIQWSASVPVKLVLRDRDLRDEDVAILADRGPLALRVLGGEQVLSRFLGDWEKYCSRPVIHFEVGGISADDWRDLALYVMPGEGW